MPALAASFYSRLTLTSLLFGLLQPLALAQSPRGPAVFVDEFDAGCL
jgi:hypothetical protein